MIFPKITSLYELMKHFDMQLFLITYGHLRRLEGVGRALKDNTKIDFGSESSQTNIVTPLNLVQQTCVELGLPVAAKKTEAVRQLVLSGTLTPQGFSDAIRDLDSTLHFEMESHVFMYVEPTKAYLYTDQALFGDQVANKFPTANFDIGEAGKCLCLNRGTSCVFHLMRVLQLGLYALAHDLQVQKLQENWQNAIEQIESEIKAFEQKSPGTNATEQDKKAWRDSGNFYSQAATHFMYVKNAWRNTVSHKTGQKYTEDEAQRIFENVKGFMQVLSTRLEEMPL